MHRRHVIAASACLAVVAMAVVLPGQQKTGGPAAKPWADSFAVKPGDLATTGENPYFVLKPGYALTLEGQEDGKTVRLVVTVLDQTVKVAGFDTRVVEERETQDGTLAEVSRNFFAIDARTDDVYYFGEDVDIYEGGKIVKHDGAWRHGTAGATLGLMMPGAPAVGLRHYQEVAPKVAMDRAEIVSVTDRITVPAGTFDKCVRTEETTPLEPKAREYKVYAPGVGLVKDGPLELVSRTRGK